MDVLTDKKVLRMPMFSLCALFALAATAQTTALRLDGTFIQYQRPMMSMSADDWRKEFDALHRARLDLVIVGHLRTADDNFMPDRPDEVDPTALLLDYADAHGMQVLLGLCGDEKDWWQRWQERDYLDRLAERNFQAADDAWKRYSNHPSMTGWYIAQELWDLYPNETIPSLRSFFQRVSAHCKNLSGRKRVSMAPFFTGRVAADRVAHVYDQLLDGVGVDILMLQDGVGARAWDDNVAGNVVPYFRAFRDVCLAHGVELWSDLESFSTKGGTLHPASLDRLEQQLVSESPFVRRFVTFDAFHYMSPYRGERQKTLHDAYLRRFVDMDFLPVFGRSIEIDPSFSYYQDRSPDSIAAEIRAAGYPIVRCVVSDDSPLDGSLIDAFRRERIGVWFATFGNGVYITKDLPAGWEAWKMVTRSDLAGQPKNDGYARLCLNNNEYRTWKKKRIAETLDKYPFAGIDIMEPHWPDYPGPTSPFYACFCPLCRDAFLARFPDEKDLPDILDPASPRAPGKNLELWRKWLAFRQASLTAFLNDLINGEGGIRQTCPKVEVCTWSLALAQPDGLALIREIHGEDATSIARDVKPDLHCIQSHWPDWMRVDLAPNYVARYSAFINPVRAAAPSVRIMVQADIGSKKLSQRDWTWIEGFEKACGNLAVTDTTCYEYSLGRYMYADPPRVAEVRRVENEVRIHFTKRLDPKTAGDIACYEVSPGRITPIRVDGSVVVARVDGVESGASCKLTVSGIADDPARRFFPDERAAVLESQSVIFSY